MSDKTVFVVGNGPSLQFETLDGLVSNRWLGMNAAYRYWEKSNTYPTYYACLDAIVGISHENGIVDLAVRAEELGIEKLLLRNNLISRNKSLSENPRVINYDSAFGHLPRRVLDLVTTGSHAAVWMASLGYKQILLLGIDANYQEHVIGAEDLGQKGMKISSSANNPNYFFENYQKPGDKYTRPNPVPEVHIGAWRRVSQYLLLTYNGQVELFNGSPVSQLDIAPFFDIDQLLIFNRATSRGPKDEFFNRMSALNREIDIEKQNQHFNLARFVDAISTFRTSFAYIHPRVEKRISHLLKSRGWKITHNESEMRDGAAMIIATEVPATLETRLSEFEIVAASLPDPSKLQRLAENLQQVHDTVIVISETETQIKLARYPCKIEIENSYIISLRNQRFWIEDFVEMLKAAAYKRANRNPWRKFIKRKAYNLYTEIRRR